MCELHNSSYIHHARVQRTYSRLKTCDRTRTLSGMKWQLFGTIVFFVLQSCSIRQDMNATIWQLAY